MASDAAHLQMNGWIAILRPFKHYFSHTRMMLK